MALAFLVLSCSPALVRAQEAAPAVTQLSEQMELTRLVDLAAQRLGLNLDYDASALQGKVTLRLGGGVSDEELWMLVNRALAARGFTTIQTAGRRSYSIVKTADAPSLVQPVPGERPIAEDGPAPGFRSVLVTARHRSGKDLAEALGKVISKPSGVATVVSEEAGGGGTLLVSDLSPRVEQALELIRRLDVPGASTTVTEIRLRNIQATQLIAQLSQLAGKRDAVAGEKSPGEVLAGSEGSSVLVVAPAAAAGYWRGLIDALDRREPVQALTYTPRHFTSLEVGRLVEQTLKPAGDERWKLVDDPLTGSLIVTATPSVHEQVRALVERLDHAPEPARRPVRTFVIRNRSVNEIKGILENLIQAGVLSAEADGSASPGISAGTSSPLASSPPTTISLPPPPASAASSPAQPAQRAPTSTPRDLSSQRRSSERPLVLTVDEGTNTLIALGEPRLLAQVESLLRQIDVRQAQVMLEVLMVTLTDGQTLDLGVELEKLHLSGGTLFRLSSLFGLGVRTPGGDRTGPDNSSGFTGVVLDPGDFSIVIRALETLNRGRSISMPRLLVSNNQEATLDSVLQQPYASVNASTTIATTSFGGTQDAGTSLSIKPQIAEGDHLVLDYSVTLSAFTGSASNPNLPPPRQQNKVQSSASIPDGHTVVVGGIEVETKAKSVSQVPLLGDIPLIGEVFKSRNNTDTRSRFFVFIRANILRGTNFEDLKYVSEPAVSAAGVDPGWPQVEPRIIK